MKLFNTLHLVQGEEKLIQSHSLETEKLSPSKREGQASLSSACNKGMKVFTPIVCPADIWCQMTLALHLVAGCGMRANQALIWLRSN